MSVLLGILYHERTLTTLQDSLQAFSSSIASLLSSRAVLSSVGVGDSTASPTAALLLSVLQDSFGRIATIAFAHRFGTALEPECKMYRLLADVLNDFAFILDCLSPIFPKPVRVIVLSVSSVLRALCGVAAGSAKASLSAHFAQCGNLGELNAKDASQETVISLVGMLVGSVVVSWITTPFATWTTLILLLSVHLETNRRAVRAVMMRTLSRQRASLVLRHLEQGRVPTPREIADEERIFEWDGVLRTANDAVVGHCTIGCSMATLLKALGPRHDVSMSTQLADDLLERLLAKFSSRGYILWYTAVSDRLQVYVVLKAGHNPEDRVLAWWQAQLLTGRIATESSVGWALELLGQTAAAATMLLEEHKKGLIDAGWDLETNAMETGSSIRIHIGKH